MSSGSFFAAAGLSFVAAAGLSVLVAGSFCWASTGLADVSANARAITRASRKHLAPLWHRQGCSSLLRTHVNTRSSRQNGEGHAPVLSRKILWPCF
jgi:hypothetical protein